VDIFINTTGSLPVRCNPDSIPASFMELSDPAHGTPAASKIASRFSGVVVVSASSRHSTKMSPRRRAGIAVGLALLLAIAAAAVAGWPRSTGEDTADERPAVFTLDALAAATLDIPVFDGCGGDRLRFANGRQVTDGRRAAPAVRLVSTAFGDVYGDGRTATVLVVGCPAVHGDAYQALVLGRAGDGTIVTRGVVAHVDGSEYAFTSVRVPTAGTVEIQYVLPWSGNMTRQHHWRAFTWTGRNWVRAPGEAGEQDPLLVRLSVSPLVLRAADGGYRGRTVATIRNDDRRPTGWLLVHVHTQDGLRLDVPAEPDSPDPAPAWSFPVGPVPAGAAHTVRLDFRVPAPAASFPTATTFAITVTAPPSPNVIAPDSPAGAVVMVTTA
jgi:hypothetical protein